MPLNTVKYYGPLGNWILQAGSKTSFGREGIIHRSEQRQMKGIQRAWNLTPPPGVRHPNMYGLKLEDWIFTEAAGDIAILDLEWEGVLSQTLPPPVYTYTHHVTQEPIETHPDFVSKIGGTKDTPKNKAKFDPEDGLFVGFPPDAGNDLGGVSEYFSAGAEFAISYATFRAPDDASDIPQIETPPNAPALDEDRNWLYVGQVVTTRGGVFEVDLSWMGSGYRGWNEIIYGKEQSGSRSGLSNIGPLSTFGPLGSGGPIIPG